MLLAGFSLIIQAEFSGWLRALAVALWLAEGGRSLGVQALAYRRWRLIELRPGGSGQATGPGIRSSLRVREGSVIIGRIAWLSFEAADGSRFGELVMPADTGADGWRKLNLLWRNDAIR